MYCKFCGKQIDDNSQYCPKCGNMLSDEMTPVIPQTQTTQKNVTYAEKNESVFKSKVLHRENSRESTVAGFFTLIVFLVIAFAVELSLVIFSNEIFRRMYSDDRKLLTTVLVIALIGDGLLILINLIKLYPIKNSYICVTETGVYGSGGTNLYFGSRSFQIPYSQITNVSTMSNGIILESGVNIYKVIIGNETTVADLIKEKIGIKTAKKETVLHVDSISNWTCPKCGITNRGVSKCSICGTAVSSSRLFADADNYNIWICPKCGKKNHNYVGTCGCGTRKP